jgi:hypothetical protein
VSNSRSVRSSDTWPFDFGQSRFTSGIQALGLFLLLARAIIRSEISGDAWPLDLDDRDLLWEFGLRVFGSFFCLLAQSSEV